MASYKQQHEQFVAGHEGTSFLEVAMITSIACISCFLRDLFLLSGYRRIVRPGLFTDQILLVLPNIVVVTILGNHIRFFILALLAISFAFGFHLYKTGHDENLTAAKEKINLSGRKHFVTYFRSIINMCTAVSILAVDFPVFPRRLAKAETFGFGGMDIGVGLFVVSNAIVSNEARGKCSTLSARSQLRKSVISSLPLIILGLARLVTVKGVDYHEHVTEYGVHWNFFFTLAALKVALSLVYCTLPVKYSTYGAAAIVIGHQICLSTGLSSYIINGFDGRGGRSGVIDANREGICSLPGYIVVYMLGVELGCLLFKPRQNLQEWLMLAKNLAVRCAISTVVMTGAHVAVQPVSRRFANAAFVFWIISLSSLMILECLLAEVIVTYIRARLQNIPRHTSDKISQHFDQPPSEDSYQLSQLTENKSAAAGKKNDILEQEKISRTAEQLSNTNVCLLEAISFNSLLYFLLANLLTGAVNMNIATMYTSDTAAVAILILYMFALSFVLVALRKKNISTKVW